MKKFFLLLPLFFCLSSCWDYSEPSAQNYVLGLGIDYEDKFILSIETVKITGEPSSLSASGGVIIESEGKTLFEALHNASGKAGKSLYWGHTELIILSETVAKEHLNEVCDLISRSNEIYSNVNLSVSKSVPAREILSAKTPGEGMVSTHIANIFENEENSHRFVCCELWQLQRNFPYTLIPVIHLEDFPIVYGSAVIRDKRISEYLSGEETQIFSLVENSASDINLPDTVIDGTTLSTKITSAKKENGKLCITVSLLNSSAPFDTVNTKNRKRLEENISTLVSEKVHSILNESYKVCVILDSSGLIKR